MKPTNNKDILKISYLGWLFFILFTSFSSLAARPAEEVLSESNYKVLSGRIYIMLKYRLQGLNSCDFENHNELYHAFKKLSVYSEKKEDVLRYLDLYYQSYKTTDACKKSLDLEELKFHTKEREKFKSFYFFIDSLCEKDKSANAIYEARTCKSELKRILTELNPHCISTQVDYDKKFHDNFECMVGDILIGRYLYTNSVPTESFITDTKQFFLNYWNISHSKSAESDGIELYSIYKMDKVDSIELRKKFLATITMLFTSTHSLSPYLKGFQDYFWRRKLFETGESEKALEIYNSARMLIDEFRTINRIILSKKTKVTILEQPISDLNRHNFMAMFLTCHYNKQPNYIKKGLPLMLGYAYESLDFGSHLKEGDTLKLAVENFKVDTDRYKLGVKLGVSFCSEK